MGAGAGAATCYALGAPPPVQLGCAVVGAAANVMIDRGADVVCGPHPPPPAKK